MSRPLVPTLGLTLLLVVPAAWAASPAAKDPRAAPRAAMQADLPFLTAKVRASGKASLKLNFADNVQYRFVKNRLAASGKTAQNSPKLFERLDWVRRQQLLGAEPEPSKVATGLETLHLITQLSQSSGDLFVESHSTIPGGSVYTYLDAGLWEGPDDNLTSLGDLGDDEEYGQGTAVFARAQARTVGDPCAKSYTGDSLKCELDKAGAFGCTYAAESIPPTCPTYTVTFEKPVDRPDDTDTDLVVCLDRSNADCDYFKENTNQQIRMPLKGRITFSSAITPSPTDSTKPKLDPALYINSISMGNDGGGCPALSAEQFLAHPNTRIVGGGKGLEWDIDWANYGPPEACFKNQDKVHLFFVLPVYLNGFTRALPVALKPASYNGSYDPTLLSFRFSCLAAGTKIRLVDGSNRAIETISNHESIRSRIAGSMRASNGLQLASLPNAPLSVVDRSIGVETLPMVRLVDAQGHSLLLTEGHPVFTDHGPILAGKLQKGDVVLTEGGPSRLTEVAREPYGGKVYNLKLGTGDELAAFPGAQTSMFANGILVGDNRMQTAMQNEANHRPVPTLAQIPREWRQDYLHSQRTTAKK